MILLHGNPVYAILETPPASWTIIIEYMTKMVVLVIVVTFIMQREAALNFTILFLKIASWGNYFHQSHLLINNQTQILCEKVIDIDINER